jgi:hypothetical protein
MGGTIAIFFNLRRPVCPNGQPQQTEILMLNVIGMVAMLCAMFGSFASPAIAQNDRAIPVASGVSYEFLARWDVDRLNRILQVDTPRFAGVSVTYGPARNAVRLYRVTYRSVVPERGNKPIVASGLLAIPDTQATNFRTISYQHGTVYGRQDVPSFPENSPETQLMIAQFAGQGYVLVGADYFGLGTSGEPEGYLVKGSHQQACYDMLIASQGVLGQLKLSSDKLFAGRVVARRFRNHGVAAETRGRPCERAGSGDRQRSH